MSEQELLSQRIQYYCKPVSYTHLRYSSMWGEWLLDFARGMAYENPDLAIQCMEESKKLLNPDINLRRVLLCELDLIVLKCLYQHDVTGVIMQIETLIEKLKEERFYSEYFKAIIKLCFCKVFIYQEELKRKDSDKETYIEELENNIYEAIITTNARLAGREVFLVYSLMGCLLYTSCSRLHFHASVSLQGIPGPAGHIQYLAIQ